MYTERRQALWCTVILGMVMVPSAEARIVITPQPGQPPAAGAVTLTEQTIEVTLSDRAAEVSVVSTYHNQTGRTLEGIYLFPLPPEAAVDRFSLYVDGEEIRAELLDAEAARAEYERIVRRVRDPALLEYAGRQLLRARIFPIAPHADASIRLYYTHPLTSDFGTTDFVFPLGSQQRHPETKVTLTVTVATEAKLLVVTSPTHESEITRDGPHRAVVRIAARGRAGAGDFHLLCTYDAREIGARFLTMCDEAGDQYFMAVIAPGEVESDQILAKDVVFCFDRSGSMQGEKIVQARDALRFCLGRLNPEDRFALVTFNDRIDMFAPRMRGVSSGAIRKARGFVDRIEADGGTDIAGALTRAMGFFEKTERPRYVVFLTDGRPTVGLRSAERIIAAVRAANTREARLFSFGVGRDLNAGLLNDLAADGRGHAAYVAPGDDVEVAVSQFFRKISSPVLADCRLVIEGDATVFDIYPEALPDVFAGSEIVVLGRFADAGPVTARLLGQRSGKATNHTFTSVFEPQGNRYPFIPKLWASRRIGHLLEAMRRNGESAEVKAEVIRLSQKHGIMTPYTAFLAAPEEVRIAQRRSYPDGATLDASHDAQGFLQFNPVTPVQQAIEAQKLRESSQPPSSWPATNQQDWDSYADRTMIAMDQVTTKRAVTGDEIGTRPAANVGGILMKSVGGKQFSLKDGLWTDWELLREGVAPTDSIAVERFSDAYFRLSRIRGMAPLLAVGERVRFLWKGVLIQIDTEGAESWNSRWNRLL